MTDEATNANDQIEAGNENDGDGAFHRISMQQDQRLAPRFSSDSQKLVVVSRAMETVNVPSISEIKQRMAETNDLFDREVFGHRNFDALDEVYTSDARILPPGAPMVTGRTAVKQFWSDLVTGAHAKSAVLSSIDVMQAGDGIVEIGRAVLTVAPPGQVEAQMEAKYVVYWREEDGRWKWHVDIWNLNT